MNRYCTGPVASEPVVAVIEIAVALIAVGADENVAGFGVGGSVSGVSVVPSSRDLMVIMLR